MARNTLRALWASVGMLVMITVPALAHHSFAMFDQTKEITLTGTVVEFHWINPHTHIILNAEAGPGVDANMAGEWDIEGASTNIMRVQGWSSTMIKAGDKLSVTGGPLKNGQKGMTLLYVTLPDGKRLYNDVARPRPKTTDAR